MLSHSLGPPSRGNIASPAHRALETWFHPKSRGAWHLLRCCWGYPPPQACPPALPWKPFRVLEA